MDLLDFKIMKKIAKKQGYRDVCDKLVNISLKDAIEIKEKLPSAAIHYRYDGNYTSLCNLKVLIKKDK